MLLTSALLLLGLIRQHDAASVARQTESPSAILGEVAREEQERTSLQKTVTGLEQRLTALEAASSKPNSGSSVAFQAHLSSRVYNPRSGSVIRFDQIQTNLGGAYNRGSGVFTAPVSGVYVFTVVAAVDPQSSQPHHILHLMIKKNGVNTSLLFLDHNIHYWLQRSGSSILQLAVGDRVWVAVDVVSQSNTIDGGSLDTYFTGFLLEAD